LALCSCLKYDTPDTPVPEKRSYVTMHQEDIKIIPSQGKKRIRYRKFSWEEAIDAVETPREAQAYLNRYMHGSDDKKAESFVVNHQNRKGDCIDYAVDAAALLSDNGYTPNILRMLTADLSTAHAVFLYRTEEGYGALGNTPVKPGHKTVESLIKEIEKKTNWTFASYHVVDLDKSYPNRIWIYGDEDLELFTKMNSLTKL